MLIDRFIASNIRFGPGLSQSTLDVVDAYVRWNGSTAGKRRLYAYLQSQPGVWKRIFYKLSEQTERHNHERIAHEREENNNDRNLMTYNVHIDNWTKKCMVQCFGTFSCWDMSSEHIVQAVEFNRDARVTDSDMENFADAIATGSNPMRLTDGSTKIVLDNNILSVFERHRRA
ncbi:hypothetical protein Pcac1_g16960 [Phytophthora cactorum]|nr:hypothetical protein Pcac1_g16960 [Phytophthora cactorum]KAG2884593.1 hypothetical protein PC114_g20003 [Phytophthora cactorum]